MSHVTSRTRLGAHFRRFRSGREVDFTGENALLVSEEQNGSRSVGSGSSSFGPRAFLKREERKKLMMMSEERESVEMMELQRQCEEVRRTLNSLATRAGTDAEALCSLSMLSHDLNELESHMRTLSNNTLPMRATPDQHPVGQPSTPSTAHTSVLRKTMKSSRRHRRPESHVTRSYKRSRSISRRCQACGETPNSEERISSIICNPCSVQLAGMALMLIHTKTDSPSQSR
ncbi:hypothetical protein PROFUN_00557 [Planoprotostelium fungivorum]|uniref:Uncharacterized protein n=1 Tax=Planoprotostelium fungivorum TaxID=1890364 RepID=A0A2P6N153_9EUKA|nr:hypothetical protein PROFUN_00557 [Planoprotostelium fungivorum]